MKQSQASCDASEGELILDLKANECSSAGSVQGSPDATVDVEPTFRCPTALDGPAITALIAASPPLDINSAYCNLLQSSDFAETCVVAERKKRIVGWISGYRPPAQPECIFVWQVAVDVSARGEGMAGRMLDALMDRPAVRGATRLTTTITQDNGASWALFSAFARRHGAELSRRPRFERKAHFSGAHDTEWQVSIAPLPFAPTT